MLSAVDTQRISFADRFTESRHKSGHFCFIIITYHLPQVRNAIPSPRAIPFCTTFLYHHYHPSSRYSFICAFQSSLSFVNSDLLRSDRWNDSQSLLPEEDYLGLSRQMAVFCASMRYMCAMRVPNPKRLNESLFIIRIGQPFLETNEHTIN